MKISSLWKWVLVLLPMVGSAQWNNLPGPLHAAFVTRGLTSATGTVCAISPFLFGGGPSGGVNSAGSYIEFNGTNQMLYFATNNFASGSTSGTIVARVFLTRATGTTFRVFVSSDAATTERFGLLQISGGLPLWDNMNGVGTESFLTGTGSGIVSGRWATIHFTTGGLAGQLGIDGAAISQTTNNAGGNFAGRWFSNVSGADHIVSGNFKRSTDNYSPGRVSAILVWLRQLSSAELMAVHNILNAGGQAEP